MGKGWPKENRLRKRKEFLAVSRESPRKLVSRHFVMLIRANGLGWFRLGLTVGRKVGSAVRRNRIKRVVREFFRLNRDMIEPGYDIVIIARQGADTLDYTQAAAELCVLTRPPKGCT